MCAVPSTYRAHLSYDNPAVRLCVACCVCRGTACCAAAYPWHAPRGRAGPCLFAERTLVGVLQAAAVAPRGQERGTQGRDRRAVSWHVPVSEPVASRVSDASNCGLFVLLYRPYLIVPICTAFGNARCRAEVVLFCLKVRSDGPLAQRRLRNGACGVFYAARPMSHVACCMPACCVLYVACCTLHVALHR